MGQGSNTAMLWGVLPADRCEESNAMDSRDAIACFNEGTGTRFVLVWCDTFAFPSAAE